MATSSNYAEYSSICVDGSDRVHVAFEYADQQLPDIFYTAKSGDTWLTPARVSTSSLDDGFPAMVADARGRLHLCWRARGGDSGYVMYTRRDTTWSPPVRIAACPASVNCQSLAPGHDGRVHLVYAGKAAGLLNDVFYMCLDGDSWSSPENISNTPTASSYAPSVSVDISGNVYVDWTEEPPTPVGQVFYRVHDAAGWGPTGNLTNDTANGSYSARLGLEVQNGHLDLFWASVPRTWSCGLYDTCYVYYMRLTSAQGAIAEPTSVPVQANLATVAPNPFRNSLHVSVIGPAGRLRWVAISDVAGRTIWKLRADSRSNSIRWDALDDAGFIVKGGVYFVHITTLDGQTTLKTVKY
jgi:hypothetical protein